MTKTCPRFQIGDRISYETHGNKGIKVRIKGTISYCEFIPPGWYYINGENGKGYCPYLTTVDRTGRLLKKI